MWKQFYEWVKWLFLLSKEAQQLRIDLDRLQHEVEELTLTVRDLTHELRHNKETEILEREKLMLEMENALLRFEGHYRPLKKKRIKTTSSYFTSSRSLATLLQ